MPHTLDDFVETSRQCFGDQTRLSRCSLLKRKIGEADKCNRGSSKIIARRALVECPIFVQQRTLLWIMAALYADNLYRDVNNITFVGKNVKNLVYAIRRIVHTMLATIFLQTNTSSVDNR